MKTREIPIYSVAYGFTRDIYRLKMSLPKTVRHDLGQELALSAIEIMKYVVLANRSHDKAPHLRGLLLQVEIQWVLMRMTFDLKAISAGEFKVLSEKLTEIGKQAEAWITWDRKRKKPPEKNWPGASTSCTDHIRCTGRRRNRETGFAIRRRGIGRSIRYAR